MSLDLLAWISPLIGVTTFFLLEKYYSRQKNSFESRTKVIFSIWIITVFINLILSFLILAPLVYLIAPLKIFSFSTLNVPMPVSFALSFLFLDFVYYCNHRMHHSIPFLWRFHRLHHSERHLDSLTTFLHHPLESISSFIIAISFAAIFDVPVIVLIVYGLTVGFHSAFTHFNVLLPEKWANKLNLICVTPNFHKIHHSIEMKQGNSNFGILFVFWDVILNTSCHNNNIQLKEMATGIDIHQSPQKFNVSSLLFNPFKQS
jgi:sterol desaturase/sphingolipid hydroxylase (fatty acid hydroxylase superfamily)